MCTHFQGTKYWSNVTKLLGQHSSKLSSFKKDDKHVLNFTAYGKSGEYEQKRGKWLGSYWSSHISEATRHVWLSNFLERWSANSK